MEDIKEKLENIKDLLIKELNPFVIVLFGSYARNTQNNESDIDIAFKAASIDKMRMIELKQKLEEITDKDIDLIDLDNIGDGFRYEILMNGIVIYCQDKYKYDLYKLDMFREYLELNEARQDIINNIKNGGTIYGK